MMGFIDRRSIANFDLTLSLYTLLLTLAGLYTVYCAVSGGELEIQFIRQFIWIGLGLLAMIVVSSIDYQFWSQFSYALYAITIILLGILLYKGGNQAAVDRWLKIGFLPQIQPSEFLKIVLIMSLAKYFSDHSKSQLYFKDLIIPGLIVGVPFVLVVSQPDLGTALSLIPICVAIFFVAGFKFKNMLKWGLLLLIPAVVTAKYILKPYQIERLTSFINPQADMMGSGWQAGMSKMSVGSGGLIGKVGQEPRLYERGFLPEQHTDFIFSVWAEETGFIGSLIIIILFIILLQRALVIATEAKEPLGMYLATGVIAMIGFQTFYNIGMVMGLLPITGLPLPFFSYGGSHMLTSFISIGILINIRMRRYMF